MERLKGLFWVLAILGIAVVLLLVCLSILHNPPYIQALATLFLVAVTGIYVWLLHRSISQTSKLRKEDSELEFKRRQFDEFYGPMFGLINQIIENTEISDKFNKVSIEEWQRICKKHQHTPFEDHDKSFEPFQKALEHEKERFRNEDIGALVKMRDIFIFKGYLAYRSTEKLFPSFLEYVAWFQRPLPYEVAKKLAPSAGILQKLFADVEAHINNLKHELSGDAPAAKLEETGSEATP